MSRSPEPGLNCTCPGGEPAPGPGRVHGHRHRGERLRALHQLGADLCVPCPAVGSKQLRRRRGFIHRYLKPHTAKRLPLISDSGIIMDRQFSTSGRVFDRVANFLRFVLHFWGCETDCGERNCLFFRFSSQNHRARRVFGVFSACFAVRSSPYTETNLHKWRTFLKLFATSSRYNSNV